jgi:cellulose synthase operon protein C
MLLDAGQPAEALRAFERANDIAPGTPQYLLSRARANAANGQVDAARQDLRNALAINPEFTPARLALVDLERRTGRLDAAAEALARLKRAATDDPAVALLEGELMLARREFEAAIPRFETAVAGGSGPRHRRPVPGAAQRRQAGAGAHARECAAGQPGDTSLRIVLADHYLSTARYPEAATHYEKLVEAQPNNAALLNNLAWLYAQGGDHRAAELAKRAYELAPEAPQHHGHATAGSCTSAATTRGRWS